jgi:hypothetical protein
METDEKPGPRLRRSTALSRELGEELRRVRRRAHMASGDSATALGWSLGKLSKLETGTRGTSPWDIGALIGRLCADKPTRDRIAAIAREPDTGHFLRQHDDNPDTLVALSLHEQTARTITTYEPFTIPSLAQTEHYTHALTRDTAIVHARTTRQDLLRRRTCPDTVLYIHEAALHTVVGSPTVMRDQLRHLAAMCEWARITPRLVPMTGSFDIALVRSATLLTFAAPTTPLAYAETDTATVFHEDPHTIARYQAKMRRLDTLALPLGQSREAFTHWADVYDGATTKVPQRV